MMVRKKIVDGHVAISTVHVWLLGGDEISRGDDDDGEDNDDGVDGVDDDDDDDDDDD
jgi:hypothetical protein